MRVLLLKPCWPYPISPEESTYNRLWPPISLAYSATLLEEAGIEPEILDAHAERLRGGRLALRLQGFDRIFITSSDRDRWLCPNLDLTPVVEAARMALKVTSEVYLMGQHGTVNPQAMLDFTGVKAVIRGEPEFAVKDLCLSQRLQEVPGIAYRSDSGILLTPPRPPQPLDRLPLPAWHRLPLRRYAYELLGDRFMLVETARGCPFQCTFCAKEVMYGPGIRRRPLDQVLREVDEAVTRYGVRSIYFYDLEFLIHRRYVEQLCDALMERKHPLRWCCQTRVTDLDEEILAKMRKAGCRLIHLGVESGSQRILDRVRKEATLADAERAVRLAHRAGIKTLCFFMLGFEGETPVEMEETIRFARRLNPTYASFHTVSPHEAIQPSLSQEKVLALSARDGSFHPVLKREVRRAILQFYARPSRFLQNLIRLGFQERQNLVAQMRLFFGYLASIR